MTRYVFPQQRETFLYSGAGEPIRQAGQVSVWIYLDSAATNLASILDLDDDPIAGSMLVVGANGLLPEFKGPDGVVELWAKSAEDETAYLLEARYGPRLAEANSGIKIKQVYADTTAALAGLALNEFADGDLIIILAP